MNAHFSIGVSLILDSFATSFRSFKASAARLLECSHGGIQEEVVSSMEDHVQVMTMVELTIHSSFLFKKKIQATA